MTYFAMTADCSQEIKAYLGHVHASAESLLAIINDILHVSKIERARWKLNPGL
jgi:signal transduction histidine kinase